MSRIDINKTYKLFIGGAFPRSESGRVYEVKGSNKKFLANPALASRKDLRDAVVAAKSAQAGWSGATAFNRGQILYRIAEIMQGRSEQFTEEISALEGVTSKAATTNTVILFTKILLTILIPAQISIAQLMDIISGTLSNLKPNPSP